MGWFGRRRGWVRGSARVVGTSDYKPNVSAQNIILRAIVDGPGIAPFDTERHFMHVRSAQWPHTGDRLPVLINPRDHGEWRVIWDEVESGVDRADRLAATMLAQSRGDDGAPVDQAASMDATAAQIVGQLQALFPGATVTTGAPPQSVDVPTQVNVHAGNSEADPVERLEKLATLHAAGIIDDAQFEAVKAQIIGPT